MALEFDPSIPIESAYTPPSYWYTSPGFLKGEEETLLANTWQFVGRADQVRESGSYFTAEICGESILVCRGDDGELRGFYNVCRHHAALIASGTGRVEEFVCPYHGWCYRLDGRLKKAPRLGPARDFHPEDFGLAPVHVCQWGPLIGVSLGPVKPEDPATAFPAVNRVMEDSNWTALQFVERRSYEVACNWKVYVDNYLDGGYHVSVLHPDLANSLDLGSYDTTVEEHSVLQSSGGAEGAARIGEAAQYGWVYPNFMMNRYGPVLDTNWVVPMGPDRCLVVFDFYFSEESLKTPEWVQESLKSSEQVQQEDIWISESVQKGLQSRSYERGRYAPKVEQGEYLFHSLVHRDVVKRES